MTLIDPDGVRWRVGRRWLPWRRRRRLEDPGPVDAAGADGDGLLGLVLLVLALAAGAVFLLVALLVVLELLLLLALLPVVLVGRVVLGRDWHVAVHRHREPWTELRAGDWQASELLVHELAAAIERGQPPPRTLGAA